MPTAAIAISSSQRDAWLRNSEMAAGISPNELSPASTRKPTTKLGQDRRAFAAGIGFGIATDQHRSDQNDRGQHGNPEQFDQGCSVTGLFGDREPGTDHLRHIMDRAT